MGRAVAEPTTSEFRYEVGTGHRVKLTVKDGYLTAVLVCPESGCAPGTTCGHCGHTYGDAETEPCYDCKDVKPSECWARSWFDDLDPSELLAGEVSAIVPVELGWRDDHPEITLRAPDTHVLVERGELDARDERVLDLEAEIAALAGLIKTLVKAGRPYFDEAFPSESLDGRGLALYNAWHRAMAEAMFAVDGRPDGLSRTFVGLDTLKDHYLAGVECDHDRKQDRASCACSRVDLGWQPSVGAAVDTWIAHVVEVEGGGEHGA